MAHIRTFRPGFLSPTLSWVSCREAFCGQACTLAPVADVGSKRDPRTAFIPRSCCRSPPTRKGAIQEGDTISADNVEKSP
jgi:hypothetical protein